MTLVLKKKLVIPAGTTLHTGPAAITYGGNVAEGYVALNRDATATFIIHLDDPGIKKWVRET